MEFDVRKIGLRIREMRKSKHLTQAELGKRLGLSDSAISKWESGGVELSIKTLQRICEALDCSIFDLLNIQPSELIPDADVDELSSLVYRKFQQLPRSSQLRLLGYIDAMLDDGRLL